MSVADFKKYGQMIAEKADVREKAKAIGMNDITGQIAYAKELGLEFTVSDMQEMAKEAGLSKDELSEEQLEQVAGGVVTVTALAVVGAVAGVASLVVGIAALGVSAIGVGVQVGSEASRNW